MSIFADGKLKPGTYKVQNLCSETYLEVLESSKELCCRPATVLSANDALVGLLFELRDNRGGKRL